MRYEIGGVRAFSDAFNASASSGIATKTSNDPVRREIEGVRAYARGKDGRWREIFRVIGEHSSSTWDSKDQAVKAARAAHYHLNKTS